MNVGINRLFEKKKHNAEVLRPRSFTLVELLLVVILLGLVAALAIPNFNPAFTKFQLQETGKNITYLMRYAQSRAVMTKKTHQLVFDEERSAYWLLQEREDPDGESRQSFEMVPGRYGRSFQIPKEISVEVQDQPIRFYPDGTIDKARIYVSNERKDYLTVSTLEQAGYVHLFDFKTE